MINAITGAFPVTVRVNVSAVMSSAFTVSPHRNKAK